MKWILVAIIGTIILAVIGFYALNNYIYQQKQAPTESGQSSTNMDGEVDNYKLTPISHASFVMNLADQTIYNDPTGGIAAYSGLGEANIILVSDIHGDHMDPDTILALATQNTFTIVPQAVKDELPATIPGTIMVMKNGDTITINGVNIEAVPMYNLPESQDARHTKGRGNGYILEAGGRRVYIAGDTSATPEMRALQNIDVAFIPMNPPFTMYVEEAAEGVLAFRPKIVHPYHYRGQNGLSDINKFKEIVNADDSNIDVQLINFYPEE